MATVLDNRIRIRKYGGTSVATPALIAQHARRAVQAQRAGESPILVVSAMSGETNRLLALAQSVSATPDPAECDVIAATGEQITAALTALAIREAGGNARSLLAHQLPIHTDNRAGEARVRRIDTRPLKYLLAAGEIPVVAGFQGVDAMNRITTLGRGGSDTTAVAIAAALGGTPCEIYTDVDGVYTGDPNVVPDARRLEAIDHRTMQRLASLGAKVLHPRSVALAAKHSVPLAVRSSFADGPGTAVVSELEAAAVTCVTADKGLARVRVAGLSPEVIGAFGVVCELISQQGAETLILLKHTEISRLESSLHTAAAAVPGLSWVCDRGLARVSLVGHLLQSAPDTVAVAARLLRQRGAGVESIQISENSASFLLPSEKADDAMRALHETFVTNQEITR